MNQDEILEILATKYNVIDPERMRAAIVYNDGFMPQDATFRDGKVGVDVEILTDMVNYDIKAEEDSPGYLERHYSYSPSIEEVVWENFNDILKDSIKANLL